MPWYGLESDCIWIHGMDVIFRFMGEESMASPFLLQDWFAEGGCGGTSPPQITIHLFIGHIWDSANKRITI